MASRSALKFLRASKDSTCILAIHPERVPEYQHTKALPVREEKHSYLVTDSRNMITKSPNLEQLQALTYTHQRYWHQYPGLEKKKKYRAAFDDNVDRPGV